MSKCSTTKRKIMTPEEAAQIVALYNEGDIEDRFVRLKVLCERRLIATTRYVHLLILE